MTSYVFMGAGTFAIILLMRRDSQSATRIGGLWLFESNRYCAWFDGDDVLDGRHSVAFW